MKTNGKTYIDYLKLPVVLRDYVPCIYGFLSTIINTYMKLHTCIYVHIYDAR